MCLHSFESHFESEEKMSAEQMCGVAVWIRDSGFVEQMQNTTDVQKNLILN
jgi:hypothetical protein